MTSLRLKSGTMALILWQDVATDCVSPKHVIERIWYLSTTLCAHFNTIQHVKHRALKCAQWWQRVEKYWSKCVKFGLINTILLSVANSDIILEFCNLEYDMMTSSNGNSFRVTGPLLGESNGHRWIPLTKPWRGDLMFSLVCAWTKDWTNNRDAGHLRCHRAPCYVSIMEFNSWAVNVDAQAIGKACPCGTHYTSSLTHSPLTPVVQYLGAGNCYQNILSDKKKLIARC